MKRLFIYCLIALFIVALGGCKKTEISNPANTPTIDLFVPDTTPTLPTSETIDNTVVQAPMFAVSVPAVTESVKADDGNDIFRYTYQNISLVLPDQEVADKVIVDFLNRVDKSRHPAENLAMQASTIYNANDNWVPFLYSVLYSPTRIDRSVLSLQGTIVTYSGGSHPTYDCIAANYDLSTGNPLTLGSVLSHIDALPSLESLIINALQQIEDEKYLWDGYETTVKVSLSADESFNEDWFFSATGLCFYFPPYEIAPYSSGVIIAEIPYEKLVGIIDDAFFPSEQDIAYGEISSIDFENANLIDYTQIAELVLSQNGTRKLLYTDTSVHNVRINWNDSISGRWTTVFASEQLTPHDAIMVKASPEEFSRLTLTYESNGKQTLLKLG